VIDINELIAQAKVDAKTLLSDTDASTTNMSCDHKNLPKKAIAASPSGYKHMRLD